MCGQNLPVRRGFASYNPDRAKAEWRAKYGPDAKPLHDQSEDRDLPKYFMVPVQNPSGVEPGLYFAVYHRATMTRVSVWSINPGEAGDWAETWEREYGDDGSNPVNPDALHMVWEDSDTHAGGYEYRA